MHLIDGRRTMERMVALTESALNESSVEPSPYAWLRSRAPVPTSYAPACEPLYPFQKILEKRTFRARGMTGSCTEVIERKFSICIEIWQVELESCVWRVSFHKYAYVHGDPVQGIDPTGKFIGTVLGVAGGLFGGLSVRASKDSANLATGALIARVLLRVSLGYALGGVVAGAYFWDPIEYIQGTQHLFGWVVAS